MKRLLTKQDAKLLVLNARTGSRPPDKISLEYLFALRDHVSAWAEELAQDAADYEKVPDIFKNEKRGS